MTDTDKTDTAEIAAAAPAIGPSLQHAREAMGLSVEDVASHLRLSVRQIHALENDEFSALPETTITRGFIRNYARLLEIPAEPLLEVYKGHAPSGGPKPITIQSANILISGGDRRPWFAYISASVVIAALLGVWLLYVEPPHGAPSKLTAQQAAPVATEAETSEPMPVAALPAAERTQPASADAETTSSTEPAANAEAKPSSASASESSQAVAVAPNADQTGTPTPKGAASLAKLELRFTDTSWVSVLDRNDQEIFNKTKAAGSAEQVEGQAPLKLVIGNAAGTVLVFNDKTIDLAPYTKLNVARITLE